MKALSDWELTQESILLQDVKALPMGEHVIRLERRDLDDWPAELFRKAQLQTLIISKNLLADVCTDIHRLKQLRRLELGDNRIVSVAPEISLLVHLEYLYLENNMLQTLPIEVGFLVQLKVLNLSGNPLSGKPCSTAVETLRDIWQPDSNHEGASILADRTHRVLRYLQDHMDKEKRCVLQKREAVWKRRQARQALHSAIRIADMNNLQAALNSAEAAGLSIEETRFPREALHVLQRMRSAVGRREADDAMAAIAAWEQVLMHSCLFQGQQMFGMPVSIFCSGCPAVLQFIFLPLRLAT